MGVARLNRPTSSSAMSASSAPGFGGTVVNANQMLALRCAKYNGTFERVFDRYRQRIQLRSGRRPLKNEGIHPMGSVVAQYVTGQTLVGAISDNGHHAERAIGEFIGREAPGTVGHRPRQATSLRRLDRLVPAGIHSVLAGGRQGRTRGGQVTDTTGPLQTGNRPRPPGILPGRGPEACPGSWGGASLAAALLKYWRHLQQACCA